MTRTCSKGMFNDFFGQWNAHVHSWWNTNNKIRKLTAKCSVSIPISTSFLQQKKNKLKSKGVQSATQRLPSRGRASSYIKNIITQSTYTCAWISAMLGSSRTLGPFHPRKPRHGKYSTPIIKVAWVQTDGLPGVTLLERKKNCWQCWRLNYRSDFSLKKKKQQKNTLNKNLIKCEWKVDHCRVGTM